MDISTTYVGVKYFRWKDNDKVEVIRICNDKDPNSFKCYNNSTKEKIRMSVDEIKSNYTRLRPDGVIYFNIVDTGDIQDVMIMMYRSKDIDESKSTPYIVCRQNITDLFANTIKPDYNNLITGFAVSEDSLPENVSMDTLLACDGIVKSVAVCIYMDDTLDTILNMIRVKDFDIVLYNLFTSHVKYKYTYNTNERLKADTMDGYCKTLKRLLLDNEFMYEFCRGFSIYPVTFEVSEKEINSHSLNLYNKSVMSNLLMRKIQDTLLVAYDKDLDLKEIQKDYFLIRDTKDKTYVVVYTYSGPTEIPVADIEPMENIAKLAKLAGYYKSSDVLNALKFNTNKYHNDSIL